MGTGTLVSVLIRPAIWPCALLAIFGLTDFLKGLRILATVGQNASLEIRSLVFFIGFILVLLRALMYSAILAACLAAFGRRETRKAIPILEEIFQAHAVFKQAEGGSSEIERERFLADPSLEITRRFRVLLRWFAEALGVVVTIPELESAKEPRLAHAQRFDENKNIEAPKRVKREPVQPLGALLRATFDLRFVRKSLALLSFCLSIAFIYWSHSTQSTVRSKDTGDALYGALILLNVCLYWCLGFPISTQLRRWIASSALAVSVWICISILLLPPSNLPSSSDVWHVSDSVFLLSVGVFIALAIVSFVDDEEVEPQQPPAIVT
jgi:hypothetical protein